MGDAAALILYRTNVLREWVDYNGHMNDACYCIVFGQAMDALINYLGVDAAYRARTACSVFTMESRFCYLRETRLGEPLRVSCELLGYDSKRLHVFFTMHEDKDPACGSGPRRSDGGLRATSEQMLMHVDTSGPRAAPFGDPVLRRVEALWAAHSALGLPALAGRSFVPLSHSRLCAAGSRG